MLVYWLSADTGALTGLYSAPDARDLPKEVARAWMATLTGLDGTRLNWVRSQLFGHQADDVGRLGWFLEELLAGRVESLGEYKKQKPRWPLKGEYYDAHSWLVLDLATQAPNGRLRERLSRDLVPFRKLARSRGERQILDRATARLPQPTRVD